MIGMPQITDKFHHKKFYRILLNTDYVIKFVNNLRQVGGFLRVLQFPPPIESDV